jgi:septum formation protein
MLKKKIKIFLASKSPRRKILLQQIGLNFQTFSVDIDENVLDGEHPAQTVRRLALHKSEAASKIVKEGIVITADTIVVLNKKIIGKPKNKKDAFKILSALSNRTHFVYTGFAIKNLYNRKSVVDYERTEVKFRSLSKKEIWNYINNGSPMDKAGAYGIQDDYGAVFVERINGCYYNVVGLPLAKLYKSLVEVL